MEPAEKLAKRVDNVLKVSGAKAHSEMDVNYGGKGYGVAITDLTPKAEEFLIKKFNLSI